MCSSDLKSKVINMYPQLLSQFYYHTYVELTETVTSFSTKIQKESLNLSEFHLRVKAKKFKSMMTQIYGIANC